MQLEYLMYMWFANSKSRGCSLKQKAVVFNTGLLLFILCLTYEYNKTCFKKFKIFKENG